MNRVKWEYRRITVWGPEGKQADEQVSRELTRDFGSEGWELVAAFYQQGEGYVYFFKRQMA